jgi:hypothetical protein
MEIIIMHLIYMQDGIIGDITAVQRQIFHSSNI